MAMGGGWNVWCSEGKGSGCKREEICKDRGALDWVKGVEDGGKGRR